MRKEFLYIGFLLFFTTLEIYPQINIGEINKELIDNYLITRTYTGESSTNYLTDIEMFDGLGYPIQKISKKVTPTKKDLISVNEYDIFRRESQTWIPIYINKVNVSLKQMKNISYAQNKDISPYYKPVYEASPLNRILQQYSPGEDWHARGKSIKMAYLCNVFEDSFLNCILYNVDCTTKNPTLKNIENYSSGQLYVTRSEDENENISYEFKNKLDQVVLTRQINGGVNHDTYYVYDDFGNLCFVLPPRIQDEGISQDKLDELAYQYRYDYRNRCVWKKLPDCEPIYYVYDKADQLIYMQDGEQRNRQEWLFSIPDAFGRPVLSGVSQQPIEISDKVIKAEYTGGSSNKGYEIKADNVTISFPSQSFLTVNYYDNYNFLAKNGFPNQAYDNEKESTGYGKRYDEGKGYEAKGQLTGTITALFGSTSEGGNFIYSTMYYDTRARLIQSHSTNHLGGYEIEYLAYNFTGQPIKRLYVHTDKKQKSTLEEYAYTYDHAGRLIQTKHKIDDLPWMVLSKNKYDELGRLLIKTIGENQLVNTNP